MIHTGRCRESISQTSGGERWRTRGAVFICTFIFFHLFPKLTSQKVASGRELKGKIHIKVALLISFRGALYCTVRCCFAKASDEFCCDNNNKNSCCALLQSERGHGAERGFWAHPLLLVLADRGLHLSGHG